MCSWYTMSHYHWICIKCAWNSMMQSWAFNVPGAAPGESWVRFGCLPKTSSPPYSPLLPTAPQGAAGNHGSHLAIKLLCILILVAEVIWLQRNSEEESAPFIHCISCVQLPLWQGKIIWGICIDNKDIFDLLVLFVHMATKCEEGFVWFF